jgi:hypothetical protein
MEKGVFYTSKKFLNKDGHESDASIFTELKFSRHDSSYVDAILKIKDCNHQIFLTIEVTSYEEEKDEGEFENSIFKITTLIDELVAFRNACEEAYLESKKRRILNEEKRNREKSEGNEPGVRGSNSLIVRSSSDPACTPNNGLGNI